eukprot:m.86017 g.86017  ORF g.86017 m.86017 type:complete len:88 (+) comp13038_c0_seq2:669-932(+)
MGLVHTLVDDAEDLNTFEEKMKQNLALCSPDAVGASKDLIFGVSELPLNESTRKWTASQLAEVRATHHAQEGLKAFLEKRVPNYVIT